MSSQPSVNDAGFPLQIQEELLNQVRYWTSQAEMKEKLNQEYDTKIQEQERIIDALNKQRRLREENEERQKEDQWNLELQNQELRTHNSDLQQQVSKSNHENTKLQRTITTATEQMEQLKDKEEKTAQQLELAKTRHEQEITNMRKHTTNLQRDKIELTKKVEDVADTLEQAQQKLAKKEAALEALTLSSSKADQDGSSASDSTGSGTTGAKNAKAGSAGAGNESTGADNSSSVGGGSAAAGTLATALGPKAASLARETSFAHQHGVINELKAKLEKEVAEKQELLTVKEELLTEKEELVKMLADREETIETMRLEGVSAFESAGSSTHSRHASKQPSRSALHGDESDLDDVDDVNALSADRTHDRNMTLTDDGSFTHEYSHGRGSPFSSGGLFAELAQAQAQKPQALPAPPKPECNDQEIMTEPIESWIHTVPGVKSIVPTGEKETQITPIKEELPEMVEKSTETVMETDEKSTETKIEMTEKSTETETEPKTEMAEKSTETDKEVVESKSEPVTEEVEHASIAPAVVAAAAATVATSAVVSALDISSAPKDQSVSTAERVEGEEAEPTPTPVPRAAVSDAALDEERRHTCDMSSSNRNETTLTSQLLGTTVDEAEDELHATGDDLLDEDDSEFRVSIGSAFGSKGRSGVETGRIQPVRTDDKGTTSVQESKERPTSLTATSGVSKEAIEATESTEGAAAVRTIPAGSEDQRQSQLILDGTGKPSTTVVSVTSQTTYTFEQDNGSGDASQQQQQQQQQQPSQTLVIPSQNIQYQHIIVDSTGATVGREKDYRSPTESISTISTDYRSNGVNGRNYRHARGATGHGRTDSVSSTAENLPTDPTMIQLVTQTMIGDYLWKFTRRRMTNMMNERIHRRYVWVHPYTKTLYWSLNNPGADGGASVQKCKSASILAVYQIADEPISGGNGHPDLPNVSLLVKTTSRNLKLKAPSREKHELWLQSISYLLSRPPSPEPDSPDTQTWESSAQVSNSHQQHQSHRYRHQRGSSVNLPGSSSGTHATTSPTHDTIHSLRSTDKNGSFVRRRGSLSRLQNLFVAGGSNGNGHGHPVNGSSTGVSRVSFSRESGEKGRTASPIPGATLHHTSSGSSSPTKPSGLGSNHGPDHGLLTVGGKGLLNGGSILAKAEQEMREGQQQQQQRAKAPTNDLGRVGNEGVIALAEATPL
ncbi:hypothetical protein BGW38_002873 [Lunasporangiospora selenospora]|uniref:Pleckstrin homology domain-containing protein n=1 Tax=Lunasporangiospora selenospora TaxID=979761 RepID=A0A9P6FTG6_9FUNG|nr:hypothetical protein BGW38_002873 [Lunasporangiospora selenospora]